MSDHKLIRIEVTPAVQSRILRVALSNSRVTKVKPLTSGQERALARARARRTD